LLALPFCDGTGSHFHTWRMRLTIEDPGTYAKPWIIKRVADLDPNDEIGEYVCTEGERDVVHMVGK